MTIKKHYYLMLSCPGDVVKERELLKECVDIINSEKIFDDTWVELQYWATDTFSDAGKQAQDSINEQIVKDSDGLIAIFNARLGTPVHNFECGTEEEITLMITAGKHVSLLFNTKPQIDLSNASSIDQITKLRKFKEEQSKKAYYREFSDEESFKTLVRREILLWLRKLIGKDIISTKSKANNEESVGEKQDHYLGENKETDNSQLNTTAIDSDAGMLDCVVYITDATQELTNDINTLTSLTLDLSNKANDFSNNFSFYNKQKNNASGILILCKQFSSNVDSNVRESSNTLNKIKAKWNEVYQYLKILNKNNLNNQDKIIIKDSVNELQETFAQTLPKIDKLIEILATTPNFQKDLKKSINGLSDFYKQVRSFNNEAITNCDEIEAQLL